MKKGDVMFKIVPTLYKAKLDAELAEAQLAELELNNTEKLFEEKVVVSQNEVALFEAKLAKAKAKAKLAEAELNFTNVRAPFDGIVDRLHEQQGSLIKEGDILTTLSDNSVMWVYFNVPEARYLEYMAGLEQEKEDQQIELVLANGSKFPQTGKIGAIEAKFNNETGNIPFRADFPNPDGLLRHGQTGTVLIHRTLKDAIVIPQRATFEILDKRYVYVVDKDDVVHQREIVVQNEMDDIFVIKKGLDVNDKIVLEGVRQVRDGEKVEYEFRQAGRGSCKPKKPRGIATASRRFPIRNPTRLSQNHVHKNPPSTGIGDRHLDHPLVPGGAGDQDPSDSPVPRHRAADRAGRHCLSRRQCQRFGRLGPDSVGAIHQRRPEHALHGLRRHQCR